MSKVGAAAVVIVVVASASLWAEDARWWHQPRIQARLRLTRDQVAALDDEFDRTLGARQRLWRALRIADEQVAAAIEDGELSDEAMMLLIVRAESFRTRRNVARVTLLVRLHRLLTPSQRAVLQTVGAGGLSTSFR